jgi:hypothetical protein
MLVCSYTKLLNFIWSQMVVDDKSIPNDNSAVSITSKRQLFFQYNTTVHELSGKP